MAGKIADRSIAEIAEDMTTMDMIGLLHRLFCNGFETEKEDRALRRLQMVAVMKVNQMLLASLPEEKRREHEEYLKIVISDPKKMERFDTA